MEHKVFYGVRKTTRVATIAETHEAIKGARNVVNVVVLPPNASDYFYQKSGSEEVSTESMEKIFKPVGELEIEENLETDNEVELTLPTHTKRRRQELPRWNKSLWFRKSFSIGRI